ncbi:hypothetical protein llh_5150 [Lactococcus cremoris subsp. cremoris A76]|nr:hypothetical protein llh_5150 [Lactococcus cremoris subsp. cremoris A76]KST87405.1 hypothetical protein ATCC19435_0595 [Lactococcus lactis subsp. lactis]MDN5426446.1 hypothetical protein [Lactococcus lactis]
MDLESGKLQKQFKKMEESFPEDIVNIFFDLVKRRNRIIHSFQITQDDSQILATKTKVKDDNLQFVISKEYLLEFIAINEKLSLLLYDFRGF